MNFIQFQSIPIFLLLFFYAVLMSLEYGALIGVHLSIISFSFFILCTPLVSFLYVVGILPWAHHPKANWSLIRTYLFWILCLIINLISIKFSPKVYSKAFLANVVYSLLTSYPANVLTLSVSFGFLSYQWLVSFISQKSLRYLMYFLGFFLSTALFYYAFQLYKPSIVYYFIDLSYSNY